MTTTTIEGFLSSNITNVTSESRLPLSSEVYTAFGCILLFTVILGFLENGTVLVIFLKNKQLRSVTNYFVLSLTTVDFLMCSFGIPISMSSNLANRWLWGSYGCIYEGFTVFFLGITQMYVLSVIALDRYIVIAKPLHKAKITNKVAGLSIGLCWFGGFFWAIMPVFGWSSYAFEAQRTSCTITWQSDDPGVISYTVTIFFFCLVIPFGVMVFSYYGVFMTIRNMSRNGVWDKTSRVGKKNLEIERKTAKMFSLIVGMYLFSWMPYAIVSFWAAFGDSSQIPVIASAIPAILAKSSTIWNPLIYFCNNKQFRIAFFASLPCGKLKKLLIKREEGAEEMTKVTNSDSKQVTPMSSNSVHCRQDTTMTQDTVISVIPEIHRDTSGTEETMKNRMNETANTRQANSNSPTRISSNRVHCGQDTPMTHHTAIGVIQEIRRDITDTEKTTKVRMDEKANTRQAWSKSPTRISSNRVHCGQDTPMTHDTTISVIQEIQRDNAGKEETMKNRMNETANTRQARPKSPTRISSNRVHCGQDTPMTHDTTISVIQEIQRDNAGKEETMKNRMNETANTRQARSKSPTRISSNRVHCGQDTPITHDTTISVIQKIQRDNAGKEETIKNRTTANTRQAGSKSPTRISSNRVYCGHDTPMTHDTPISVIQEIRRDTTDTEKTTKGMIVDTANTRQARSKSPTRISSNRIHCGQDTRMTAINVIQEIRRDITDTEKTTKVRMDETAKTRQASSKSPTRISSNRVHCGQDTPMTQDIAISVIQEIQRDITASTVFQEGVKEEGNLLVNTSAPV